MSQDSTERSVAAAQHGGISHLRPWRKGESGNPHGRAVRAIKLFEMMVTDFDELTAVESALLLQACRLMARSERAMRCSLRTFQRCRKMQKRKDLSIA